MLSSRDLSQFYEPSEKVVPELTIQFKSDCQAENFHLRAAPLTLYSAVCEFQFCAARALFTAKLIPSGVTCERSIFGSVHNKMERRGAGG